jgi:hypothetical protein
VPGTGDSRLSGGLGCQFHRCSTGQPDQVRRRQLKFTSPSTATDKVCSASREERWRPVVLVTLPRCRALRQAPLAAPPHNVYPLSIHRSYNRLRSPPVVIVRFSAFLASRRGKSDGGERRRPCQQGLISPGSLVRIPPPPPEDLACRSRKERGLGDHAPTPLCVVQPFPQPFRSGRVCSSLADQAIHVAGDLLVQERQDVAARVHDESDTAMS